MENLIDKCFRCEHFSRYYTKGTSKFDLTKIGKCSQKSKIVNAGGTCECFKGKHRTMRSRRLLKITLSDLLTEISEIRAYLEAEQDESNKL